MKIISRIVFLLIVVVVLVIAGKNMIVKIAVEKGVPAAIGLPVKVGNMDIGLLSTHLGINDLTIYNPEGFPKEMMFHAPEIYVDYKLGAILAGKVHLEDIRLDFDQFVIVKNKDGLVNLEVLKPKEQQVKPGRTEPDQRPQEPKEKKKVEFQIDHMKVKIGKVVYKDYSQGGELAVREFKVNIEEEFSDINNSNIALIAMSVMQKALLKTSIASVIDVDLNDFTGALGGSQETVDKLKEAADMFKDKIKLPFGN